MLYIIIPVYNRWHYTQACLQALRQQTFQSFQTIVVDDGSTDKTAQLIRASFAEVMVLNGGGNLFWTAAVNLGIDYALQKGATHIMTLNNDTLPARDFLEQMHACNVQHPYALLGALEVDATTKRLVYGGERIDWLKATTQSVLRTLPADKRVGLHSVDWLPGRGLFIPRPVFECIGLFNAKVFPHYFADLDFTHLALSHGFALYLNYNARLLTYPSESGDWQHKVHKTPRNYLNHLFGIKGGGNLRDFTRFAWRHCPRTYLPSYLLIGYLRRLGGYFLK